MRKGILNLHEKSKKVGVFKCPICQDKAFKTKEFLEKHLQRRHVEKYTEEEEAKHNEIMNSIENKKKITNEKKLIEKLNTNINENLNEDFNEKNINTEDLPLKPSEGMCVIDENKIINEISDKLTTEISRIQFNLQLEFNEKLKQLEEHTKENAEFMRNTYTSPPIEVSNLEKNEVSLSEMMRFNENLMKSQNNQINMDKNREEMWSSLAKTQRSLDDYAHKLKRLNKSMKKITKENQTFQKSFFKNLKEYQKELMNKENMKNEEEFIEKTEESRTKLNGLQRNENSNKSPLKSPEKSPIKNPVKLQESPEKIIRFNTHVGDLLSDNDSVDIFLYIFLNL